MPRFFVLSLSLLLVTATIVGCSYPTTPVATEPDLVGVRIAQASEKAAQALDAISGIEQQRTPLIVAPDDYASVPPQMNEPITLRWTGPVEQIAQTLASRAGLRYLTRGQAPPVPITVVVDVYQQPLIEVLRSIGLQAGRRADIHVDGQMGILEMRYAPVDKL